MTDNTSDVDEDAEDPVTKADVREGVGVLADEGTHFERDLRIHVKPVLYSLSCCCEPDLPRNEPIPGLHKRNRHGSGEETQGNSD
jgi:hypothetical protein